jgi:hypothetical protein
MIVVTPDGEAAVEALSKLGLDAFVVGEVR